MTAKTETKPENKIIKLMIVEDYRLTRLSLKTILNTKDRLNVVADAENAADALDMLNIYNPDVVLMDIGLPAMNGIDATAKIKELSPNTKVIMLTTHEKDEEVVASFGAGANGYCLKDVEPDKLAEIIRSVAAGACWIDSAVSEAALNCFPKPNKNAKNYREMLTQREREILKYLTEGLTNNEIANHLFITTHTVKAHICNIMQKFNVQDRVQVAVKAIRENIL